MLSENKLGYLFIVLAMLIWGSIGIIVRLIPYPSELIVFYRVLFAFVFLVLVGMWNKDLKFDLKGNNKLILAGMGISLALNWVFFFQAVKMTTIASATLSYYTSPILVTLLSAWLLKEKLTWRGIIALLFGFTGIAIMLSASNNLTITGLQGIGYGVLAALFYALFTITSKVVSDLPARLLTMIQTGIVILILFPFILKYNLPDVNSLFLLVIIGVIHTALALMLYVKGLSLIKVQDVGILSYLDPVSAILFALIFLGEVPTITTAIGGGLILFSSYLVVTEDKEVADKSIDSSA